jgi:hypothetical protein
MVMGVWHCLFYEWCWTFGTVYFINGAGCLALSIYEWGWVSGTVYFMNGAGLLAEPALALLSFTLLWI